MLDVGRYIRDDKVYFEKSCWEIQRLHPSAKSLYARFTKVCQSEDGSSDHQYPSQKRHRKMPDPEWPFPDPSIYV